MLSRECRATVRVAQREGPGKIVFILIWIKGERIPP
jgi:hypothetical protein